jgi:hypothetical protein
VKEQAVVAKLRFKSFKRFLTMGLRGGRGRVTVLKRVCLG